MRASFFAALLLVFLFNLDSSALETEAEKKKWWEKRADNEEFCFPHNAHIDLLKEKGDPCLSCHPFLKNTIKSVKTLDLLNVILNEPLEAICHSCHVDELTAPSHCILCHKRTDTIWPGSHNFDYLSNHGGDATLARSDCMKCHIAPSFCTDCHFGKDDSRASVHGPGYRGGHGIDARLSPGRCGKCHSPMFCSDCHRSVR